MAGAAVDRAVAGLSGGGECIDRRGAARIDIERVVVVEGVEAEIGFPGVGVGEDGAVDIDGGAGGGGIFGTQGAGGPNPAAARGVEKIGLVNLISMQFGEDGGEVTTQGVAGNVEGCTGR